MSHAANLHSLLARTPALTAEEREWLRAAADFIDLEFRIARLDLRKGDILVVKFGVPVSAEMVEIVKNNFAEIARGLRLLVIDARADLSILTAAEIAERA